MSSLRGALMPWAGQTVDSKLAGSLGPAAPPRPLLHTFLLPAAASSDMVINSGRGWPLALRIGEAGRSRDGVWCWTLRLGQGVTGFQVARGNFVCLWEGGSARGNHLCRHQEACQPGAGAGLHLPGAAHCSLRMPRPKGLERGLEGFLGHSEDWTPCLAGPVVFLLNPYLAPGGRPGLQKAVTP